MLLWDLETSKCVRRFDGHSGGVLGVDLTPDGRYAVSGSNDVTLRLWDIESGAHLRTFEGHRNQVFERVCHSGRSPSDFRSSDEDSAGLDLASAECLRTLAGGSEVLSVRITPDGQRIVAGCFDKTVRVWNLNKW